MTSEQQGEEMLHKLSDEIQCPMCGGWFCSEIPGRFGGGLDICEPCFLTRIAASIQENLEFLIMDPFGQLDQHQSD